MISIPILNTPLDPSTISKESSGGQESNNNRNDEQDGTDLNKTIMHDIDTVGQQMTSELNRMGNLNNQLNSSLIQNTTVPSTSSSSSIPSNVVSIRPKVSSASQLRLLAEQQKDLPPAIYGRSLEAMRIAASMMKRSDEVWQEMYAQQQKQVQQRNQQQQKVNTEEADRFPQISDQSSPSKHSPKSRTGGGGGGSRAVQLSSQKDSLTNEVDANLEQHNLSSSQSNINFSALLPSDNNSAQHSILNTPLQPGAAALLSMTDSLEHSSAPLQPKDSERAYKPVKLTFSDPFASKEREAKNTVEAHAEGDSRPTSTRGGSRTSKRTYSKSRIDHSKSDVQTEKRERLETEAIDYLSDNMDADGEFEIHQKGDDVNFNTTEHSNVRGKGTSGASRGKGGRQASTHRKGNSRPRSTRTKKGLAANENKDLSEAVVNNESNDIPENVENTSSIDNPSGLIEGAEEAVGHLMQQEQEWQQILEITQRENEEKRKLQQTQQELEQILRQDMALKMQQASAQSWTQYNLPQQGQTQIGFPPQNPNLFVNPAPWLFNQSSMEKFDQSAFLGLQPVNSVQAVGMPSSDTIEAAFPQTEYLEIEPGQFQSIPIVSHMGLPSQLGSTTRTEANVHPHVSDSTAAHSLAAIATAKASVHPNFHTVVSSQPSASNSPLFTQSQVAQTQPQPQPQPKQHQQTAIMTKAQQNERSNSNVDKNTHYILTDHGSSNGELSWRTDDQENCQRLAGKFYMARNTPFPCRPLFEDSIKQIHDDWAVAHSQSMDNFHTSVGSSSFSATYHGSRSETQNRFPSVESTRESTILREIWQDLERRRILYLTDPNLIESLRKEAASELKREAAQRAMLSASVTNALTWATIATQEPPSPEVEIRARMNWERQKSSAAYSVGLLRQAEYCVAEGSRAFTHNINATTNVTRNEAALSFFSASNEAALLQSLNVQGHHRPPLPSTPLAHKKGGGVKRENDRSNVYSATLPHGGGGGGSSTYGGEDTVLGSPSILAQSNASISPVVSHQVQGAENTNNPAPPERKDSNDSWDAAMMRKL